MKTIHKFSVVLGTIILDIPATAKVVRFAPQRGLIYAWIELDKAAPKVHRVFRVVGTGHPIDDEEIHVASCEDDQFVWHLYEMPIEVMAANMEAEDRAGGAA